MKKYLFLSLSLILALSGCKEAPDFGDSVFITGTLGLNTIRFAIDGTSSMGITVSSSAKATEPVQIEIAPAPELLDAYNKNMERNYQLPASDAYSVGGTTVTISPGKSVSSALELTADGNKLKDGVSYCLPVTIKSVNGGLGILQSSCTAYIMFTKVITSKVVQMRGGASFEIPTFAGKNATESPIYAMNQMTLECKVRPSNLSSQIAESLINPIMGSHESLLLRFGDGSNIPSNKLNFAKVSIGTNYHPDNKPHYESTFEETFENDNWYHVAVVYDGSTVRFYLNGNLEIEKSTTGGQINLAMSYGGHGWDDTFAIGRSYGNHWTFKGCLSEVRLWNVARSQSQLEEGMCYVDPTTEGLLAYWRFNGQLQDDGSVLDETGHGHNAHPKGNIYWLENQKCPF
ncbi:hypothetical protein C7120_12495 [Prevotella sp. oral taxon 376]|uniref:DUF1735 and LamG domain-containing protein n=1 Tax=Prevotella sp. oral taxon 376 TaxID=712466 RepID=UPI000D1F77D7|nr:DUF1735 and LamG domain-containing protein [Prevotella sp. oral taxon 376]PTL32295.1 hypothetical protein C7120_12495 [Prevotella sp. oral taxon 376]